jgi:hypothetical protein
MMDFLTNPALTTLVVIFLGYLGLRTIRRDAAGIHVLVNARLDDTLDMVEALQAQVEKLGGAKAPPTREQAQDAADRQTTVRE